MIPEKEEKESMPCIIIFSQQYETVYLDYMYLTLIERPVLERTNLFTCLDT